MVTTTTLTAIGRGFASAGVVNAASKSREVKHRAGPIIDSDSN
jgi:hypothetical protein